jgi:hypothetical protein
MEVMCIMAPKLCSGVACSSEAFPAESVRGGRCLELGAGVTGLPSIVAFHRGLFKEVLPL